MVLWVVIDRRHPRRTPRYSVALSSILGLTSPSSHKKPPLSFHALTWNPFCNPFVFTFMHGMGVPLFTRIKSKGTHEHDNFGRPGHPARSSIVETGMETNVSVD